MEKKIGTQILKYSIGGAILEIIYCVLVALFMLSMENIADKPGGILTIVAMLLLLVFSAALSGFLIFGYPLYLVTQKEYRLAIISLVISLVTLMIGALIIVSLIMLFR
ncbi:hypothetical protein KKF32_01475 [Patescibacteria group bacterium]|nr:hypothetical protein [Patescibacteria group bacterium]